MGRAHPEGDVQTGHRAALLLQDKQERISIGYYRIYGFLLMNLHVNNLDLNMVNSLSMEMEKKKVNLLVNFLKSFPQPHIYLITLEQQK